MSRRQKGLRMSRGERYALLPREVLESESYLSLPDWTVRVLLALVAQYYGTRNGSLALPVEDARGLGVRKPWRVYAGLQILCLADLIVCTRRGRLVRGGKLSSMYGLTWKGIDEPAVNVAYDAGISVCPIPTHSWAKWTRPSDWDARVRGIVERMRGSSRWKKNPVTPLSGTDRTPLSGTEDAVLVPPRRVRKAPVVVPPCRVASKTLGVLPTDGSGS